jgi:nucleotide-binding universal stress UspA family protein
MGTIVVGYVATAEGTAALDRAISEAGLRQAELVVVISHKGGVGTDDEHMADTDEEIGRLEQQLVASGVRHTIRSLVRGNDPAEDILEVVEETGAELIVIGLRRRSPVGKLILGSNAQRVLLDASCPVLAVKAAR